MVKENNRAKTIKNRITEMDLCIVGAGASGMAAAIRVKMNAPEARVLVLEKMSTPCRKVRATGNSRCNITNANAEGIQYGITQEFLASLGIYTVEQDHGMMYPLSESAQDVVDTLVDTATRLGIRIICNCDVTSVNAASVNAASVDSSSIRVTAGGETSMNEDNPIYILEFIDTSKNKKGIKRQVRTRKLIIATGGKSAPEFGTTGDGYRLARSLGHMVVSPIPVLTQIECIYDEPESLAGVRAKGWVTLLKKGEIISREYGEVQFTKAGISGICVFNTTRHMRLETRPDRGSGMTGFEDFEIRLNLKPDGLEGMLKDRRDREHRRIACHDSSLGTQTGQHAWECLRTIIKDKLAKRILSHAQISRDTLITDLTEAQIDRIAYEAENFAMKPTGVKGWRDAQCTSGGVALEELNESTMESLVMPGLYFTGEVTDYDGPCGGYNLDYAWRTGCMAGDDILNSYHQE